MSDTVTRSWKGLTVPTAGTYAIDASHTTVGFVAKHLMVSKTRGRFEDVAGTITFGEDPLATAVDVTVQMASITTGNEQRDGHLKSPDFFNLDEHPTMTFVSTAIRHEGGDEFVLVGDLTIKGITKSIELETEFEGVAKDPWGGDRVGFSAKGEIDREDFDVSWNVALEAGGVLVGKKIKIELDVEAVRQA
jgi:polyisoprenoid-binding protein YceI